ESAGSSLDRIVQVHAMIYDRIEYDVLNRAYRQYLSRTPLARTVMSVQIEAGVKVILDVIAAARRRQAPPPSARRALGAGNPFSAGAVRAGEFVFLSGMEAAEPVTVASETRQILTEMAQCLEAAGSSLAQVVKVNVLIYSMLEYANMNDVYRT